MTDQVMNQSEAAPKREPSRLYEMYRKMVLASIGAMAFAQDEAEAFVKKLIERGELAEKEGAGLLKEMREKRKERLQKFEDQVGKRMEAVLERMNVPTKGDVDALNAKIAELTAKIDQLSKKPE